MPVKPLYFGVKPSTVPQNCWGNLLTLEVAIYAFNVQSKLFKIIDIQIEEIFYCYAFMPTNVVRKVVCPSLRLFTCAENH